jgi:hypothetical protein
MMLCVGMKKIYSVQSPERGRARMIMLEHQNGSEDECYAEPLY